VFGQPRVAPLLGRGKFGIGRLPADAELVGSLSRHAAPWPAKGSRS